MRVRRLWQTQSTPAQTLQAAQQGDSEAFRALYEEHVGQVYGLCLRMTSDPNDAEEFTQRAFVRAYSALAKFRGDSSIKTWLHRIAVNEILMEARRKRPELLDPDAPEFQRLVQTDTHGLRLDLEQAIGDLPERARQVFVLRALYGFTHPEIASTLNIAEGTAKAQYHLARERLKTQFSADEMTHE